MIRFTTPDGPPPVDPKERARREADGWRLKVNMWETRAGGHGWPPHWVATQLWWRPRSGSLPDAL